MGTEPTPPVVEVADPELPVALAEAVRCDAVVVAEPVGVVGVGVVVERGVVVAGGVVVGATGCRFVGCAGTPAVLPVVTVVAGSGRTTR